MASEQLKHMTEFFASITERVSKPDIDLTTMRDIVESLHLAAIEPEGVTYAEVDADGVPALWCIPQGCDADRVLLHSHAGGMVVFSMYSDRARPWGTSPRWRESAPSCCITGVHRNTSSQRKSMTWRRRITGCSPRGLAPRTLPASVTLSAAILL